MLRHSTASAILSLPHPVVLDSPVTPFKQEMFTHCVLHYARKLWSDARHIIHAQGVTIDTIRAEVTYIC